MNTEAQHKFEIGDTVDVFQKYGEASCRGIITGYNGEPGWNEFNIYIPETGVRTTSHQCRLRFVNSIPVIGRMDSAQACNEIYVTAYTYGWKLVGANAHVTYGKPQSFQAFQYHWRGGRFDQRLTYELYVHYEKDGSVSKAVLNWNHDTVVWGRETKSKRAAILAHICGIGRDKRNG